MAVDRVRRDALANSLLQFLQGGMNIEKLFDACSIICRRHSIDQTAGRRFPVMIEGSTPPIVDPVLDDHVVPFLRATLPDIHAKKEILRTRAWSELTRTLVLLRSNLDGNDLELPRLSAPRHFAFLKLALIAGVTFLATLIATLTTAPVIGPTCVVLWPLVGICLISRHSILVRPALSDDPRSRPFLAVAQYQSRADLVSADEVKNFKCNPQDRPPEFPTSPPPTKWRYLLIPAQLIIGLAMIVGTMFFFITIFLILWPYFCFDVIRAAKRRQNTAT